MILSGLHILLAEDNLTNQMVATQMLESLGARVSLASDGQEAMDMMENDVFDVALIDIEMPRISGVDVIRSLRQRGGRYSEMPMIALTAYVMREHRAAIGDAGADGIISKPILSIEQLGDDVMRILNGPRNKMVGPPAEFSQPAEEDEVIDTAVFRDLCSVFDPPRREELLHKVSQDIGVACGQIRGAQLARDSQKIRAASHVLISVAGTIGAMRLQSLAQCLNSAGRAEDSGEIDRIAPDLIAEAARVLEFIDRL
jgi:CheY-like chemotaxis protein